MRPDCIRGSFNLDGEHFHVLELPWRNNARNASCIPPGTYEARFLPRSTSGKYRNVFWLQDVPGRSGILIHSGNVVAHTRGCLIIGKRRGTLAGQPAVLNSRTALLELAALTGQNDFHLTIPQCAAIGDQT